MARLGAPIAKYWVCKRGVAVVAEALECHGGNGFVEDHLMARLYREAPLNGIWEGTGNVICLDVLRALSRDPECVSALVDELRRGRGYGPSPRSRDRRGWWTTWPTWSVTKVRPDGWVERLALVWAASLMARHEGAELADAMVAGRIARDWSGAFGTLPPDIDSGAPGPGRRPRGRLMPELTSPWLDAGRYWRRGPRPRARRRASGNSERYSSQRSLPRWRNSSLLRSGRGAQGRTALFERLTDLVDRVVLLAQLFDQGRRGRLLGLAAWSGRRCDEEPGLGVAPVCVARHAAGAFGVAELAGPPPFDGFASTK